MILAWDSEEARDEAIERHGHKAKQYEDRPVRKSYWKQKRDHPIHGLAHYEIPEDETE